MERQTRSAPRRIRSSLNQTEGGGDADEHGASGAEEPSGEEDDNDASTKTSEEKSESSESAKHADSTPSDAVGDIADEAVDGIAHVLSTDKLSTRK